MTGTYHAASVPIPKIIHQTAETAELPDWGRILQARAIGLHPEWEYRFYDDAARRELVRRQMPGVLPSFDAYRTSIQRTDMFRMVAVYAGGGFYVDLDIDCRLPLDELCRHGCVVAEEKLLTEAQAAALGHRHGQRVANYMFGAEAGHPFLFDVLEEMVGRAGRPILADEDVLESTGPGLVTDVYHRVHDRYPDLVILPNDGVVCRRCRQRSCQFGPFAAHLHAGSWRWTSALNRARAAPPRPEPPVAGMLALKVKGPVRGGTGYDHHTRSFLRGFIALGTAVELEECPLRSPPLPADQQDPLFACLSAPVESRVQVQFELPNRVVLTPGLATAVYTMFEASRIPPHWARQSATWEMTVVPSRASFDAWVASGIPADRVRVCPLGIRPGLDAPDVEPLTVVDRVRRAVTDHRYRFLNVAEVNSRKNHLGILEAWLRATTPADDAILILKVNSFQPGRWELLQLDLADLCQRLGRTFADAARVVTLTHYLPDHQLPSLFRTATHYLSLSFGEGWDQPMIEAGAAGLELIAPRHSAYLDYLDDESAHLLPSREVPVASCPSRLAEADTLLFEGLSWWAPDVDAAAALIRDVIDGRAPAKVSPQRRLLDTYRWETVSRRLLEILAEL